MNWISKKHHIITHILLTYFTCGIWLIVWFACKDKKEQTFNEYVNEYTPTGNAKLDDFMRIQKQYQKVLELHYKNVEKINMLYTVANNLSLPNSNEMQKVISLCIEDIKLAPEILNYCKEMANNYDDVLENHLINYVTFQRLAIIYEKQKEYEKAIDICKYAIELGFYKDGTTGQMPGRLARLVKKYNAQKEKLN